MTVRESNAASRVGSILYIVFRVDLAYMTMSASLKEGKRLRRKSGVRPGEDHCTFHLTLQTPSLKSCERILKVPISEVFFTCAPMHAQAS